MAVTPNYSWPVPVNTDYVKDGAEAIKDLGDAIDATVFGLTSGALTLVKTQVVGTAVSSVTVSNAFSATYSAYLINCLGINCTVDTVITYLKFNNSTGSTYNYAGRDLSYAGAGGNATVASTSAGIYAGITGSQSNASSTTVVFNPFAANNTITYSQFSGQNFTGNIAGQDKNAVSQTGFSLNIGSGTMTGGTISVYGYRK